MEENESKKRILLVEDEEHIQDAVKMNLEMEGYYVAAVDNGKDALTSFKREKFDLVILDVMLPEIDGFTVCKNIRLIDNHVPVLFLTAKSSGSDRVQGLKIGGDDYLIKPFNLEELLLRVEKLLIRSGRDSVANPKFETYDFAGNTIDFNTYEASNHSGETRKLTKKETMLLKLLIENENQAVSRDEILESVWGYDVYPSTRTIDNFILNFRKFFEKDAKNPVHFHSIRGVGYKFKS